MRKFIYVTLAIILIGFIVKGAIHVKQKLLLRGVVFQAFRKAPISGIWLGLYGDRHFNFGYFGFWGIDVEATGSYQIRRDTLTLRASPETENTAFNKDVRFLILENVLKELPTASGGIGYLENGRNQPKLAITK